MHGSSACEVVVAGHISLDLVPALRGPVRIEPGHLVQIGPVTFSTGGAVANTGLALHRLGARVRLIGRVGDDLFGRALLDALEPELAAGMVVAPGEATSYTIVISPPGVDRTFLHCPGANERFCAEDVPYGELTAVRLLHFGYPPLMPAMYAGGGSQLRQMFQRAHEAGPATSLDLCMPDPASAAGSVDWRRVLAAVLPHVDIFAPSVEELLFMTDQAAFERVERAAGLPGAISLADLRRVCESLFALGATIAAIKLGDQGLYLRTCADAARIARFCDRLRLRPEPWCNREVLAPCFRPRRLAGTTGAGDATIAGLLAAILRGEEPGEAATAATAVGACSVEGLDPTTGIPSWAKVADRIAAGWERMPIGFELGDRVQLALDARGTWVSAR